MKFNLMRTWDSEAESILEKYKSLKEFEIEIIGKKLYITLNGLEDLLKLSKRYGELIVSASDIIDGEDTIEIYDNYRE